MPYISKRARVTFSSVLDPISVTQMVNAGELNFLLTQVCLSYLNNAASMYADRKNIYSDYNDVIGALEACKLEFYRRLVSDYEDKKIEENGDVYKK